MVFWVVTRVLLHYMFAMVFWLVVRLLLSAKWFLECREVARPLL